MFIDFESERISKGQMVLRELFRRGYAICRLTYNMAGPNHLWQINSSHKLVYINGDSLSMDASMDTAGPQYICKNNKANTVFQYLEQSVQEFGLPSKLRGNRGMENFGLTKRMSTSRGLDFRHFFLADTSVHNQHNLRLQWAEVNRGSSDFIKICSSSLTTLEHWIHLITFLGFTHL